MDDDAFLQLPIDRRLMELCERKIEAAIPKPAKPSDILKAGWALFDALAAELQEQPDCRKGCAFCCTLPVHISDVEAEMLAQAARGDGERRRRLKENAKRARGLDEVAYTRALIQCAFLDDGKCSVYDIRPSACRYWHSMDVKACQAGYGVPFAGIPLHRERMVLFKAVTMATGLVMGRHLNRRPSLGGNNGELHRKVVKALRR